MRMGPDARRTAEEIVNTWSEQALKNILQNYGELHYAAAMAEDIVRVCTCGSLPSPHTSVPTFVRACVPFASRMFALRRICYCCRLGKKPQSGLLGSC